MGNGYQRDFASWRIGFSTGLKRKVGHRNQCYLGYEAAYKDYDETPGLNSIDWTSHYVSLRYRHRLSNQLTGRLWAKVGYQRYDEEPANNAIDGNEKTQNPVEEHLLHQVTMWATWKPSRRWKSDVQYRWSRKDDLFEQYESYNNHRVKCSVSYQLSKNWHVAGDIKFDQREFDRRPAYETGGQLSYQRWQVGMHVTKRLSPHAVIQAQYGYQCRESNRSFGTVYRDYSIHLMMIGWGSSF